MSMTLVRIVSWDRRLPKVWKQVSSAAIEIYPSNTVTVSYYGSLVYLEETKKNLLFIVYQMYYVYPTLLPLQHLSDILGIRYSL